jgi:uncharacterized membrane protein
MKRAALEQRRTLEIADGYRFFRGVFFGLISLCLAMLVPTIVFLIFMYMAGSA